MLVKLMMANPKSYSIWEHRVWTINIGLDLERQYLAALKAKKEEAASAEGQTAESTNNEEGEPQLMNMPGQEEVSEDDNLWKSAILENELKLCSKMLMQDERNFHCWNYRNQMVNIYCNEIATRMQGSDKT